MTFHFTDVDLWEAVAALQILQALMAEDLHESVCVREGDPHTDLFIQGGLYLAFDDDYTTLAFSEAHRAVERLDKPYCMVLAEESGFPGLELKYPSIPKIKASETGGVVLCPWGLKPELNLPMPIWTDVVRHLRTYDYPVLLIGNEGQRFGNFTEGEILSNRPIEEKLAALAEAKLVVGVPNAYTWLATGWDKRILYTYPDNIPARRWFPFISDRFGRIQYEAHDLHSAALLAGFRKMIGML